MAPTWYRADAPGTLMLLGEHAVLRDKPALIAAIDKRIRVTLVPRNDNKILIESILGELTLDLAKITDNLANNESNLPGQNAFRFVWTAIKYFPQYSRNFWNEALKLPSGFELRIHSEFSSQIGFGSSAAVTVAVVAVLLAFAVPAEKANIVMEKKQAIQLFQMAKWVIQKVQKVGSGADVFTAVFGGMVIYQQRPPYLIKKISTGIFPDLIAVYSGSKTPTAEVIQKVNAAYTAHSSIFDNIFFNMQSCVEKAIPAIENQDWTTLGEILNIHQGLMQAIGVSTSLLNELCDHLNEASPILGAKISGSGLGDCIIGVGAPGSLDLSSLSGLQNKLRNKMEVGEGQADQSSQADNIQIFPIQISLDGVKLEQLHNDNECNNKVGLNAKAASHD